MDVLDPDFEKSWHQKLAPTAEIAAELGRQKSEVIEKIEGENGGPCRVEPTAR